MLAWDDRLPPNGRGQGHVTFFIILPQSPLAYRMAPLPVTLKVTFAIRNLARETWHEFTNSVTRSPSALAELLVK